MAGLVVGHILLTAERYLKRCVQLVRVHRLRTELRRTLHILYYHLYFLLFEDPSIWSNKMYTLFRLFYWLVIVKVETY